MRRARPEQDVSEGLLLNNFTEVIHPIQCIPLESIFLVLSLGAPWKIVGTNAAAHANRMRELFPFLSKKIASDWLATSRQTPVVCQKLITECLTYAKLHGPAPFFERLVKACKIDTWSPELRHLLFEAVEQLAQLVRQTEGLPPSREPPFLLPWLFYPPVHAELAGLLPPTDARDRPICSMHDLGPAETIDLITAVDNLLVDTGTTLVAENTQHWFTDKSHHWAHWEICAVAHEFVWILTGLLTTVETAGMKNPSSLLVDLARSVQSPTFRPPSLNQLPQSFLLDVLVQLQIQNPAAAFAHQLHGMPELTPDLPAVRRALWRQVRDTGIPLYAYQEASVQWILERERLVTVRDWRFRGGILDLPPGMGKTRIGLTLCSPAVTRDGGGSLVIVPKSVLDDWMTEYHALFDRLPDDLRPLLRVAHPSNKAFKIRPTSEYDEATTETLLSWLQGPAAVVLTTRKTLMNLADAYSMEEVTRVCAVASRFIIDESHEVSNKATQTYKQLAKILKDVPCGWGFTGTPFRNARYDVTHQLRLLHMPADWSTEPANLLHHVMRLEYGKHTIEILPAETVQIATELMTYDRQFYQLIVAQAGTTRPAGEPGEKGKVQQMLGLLTEIRLGIISMDLIPVERWVEMIGIAERQQVAHARRELEEAQRKRFEFIEKASQKQQALRDEQERQRLQREQQAQQSIAGSIFRGAIRYFWGGGSSSEPAVATTSTTTTTTAVVAPISPRKRGGGGGGKKEEGVVFVDRLPPNPLPDVRHVHGPNQSYRSARLAAVVKTMVTILTQYPNDKMLIFCSFVEPLNKIKAIFQMDHPNLKATTGIELYTGKVQSNRRTELRKQFKEDPTLKVLLLTYGAGGAGLNLQPANHVLEVDPMFNDATRIQAEARAHRVGQKKTVRIYRFYAPDTYETRMEQLRLGKAADWEDMLRTGDFKPATGDQLKRILDLI